LIDQEDEIHTLCLSEDPKERAEALKLLYFFRSLSDKQQAWEDFHKLTNDEDFFVKYRAAEILGYVFSQVPDKQQAWEDLIRLIDDKYLGVRSKAASAIVSVFPDVPYRQQVWNDLIKLTNDQHRLMGPRASDIFDFAFSYMPDKQQAWNDLIKLAKDKDGCMSYYAVDLLRHSFYIVPDKQQAWEDLHRLTNDEDWIVRSEATKALGSAFSHVPDKQQALNDLHKLTMDKNLGRDAIYSLGKVSIFKASMAEKEDDYKRELENAITLFEKCLNEFGEWCNPSSFCLPFYRSFYSIIFKGQATEEVNKYLADARDAVKDSKSKELLFEAVNNLANALNEVQNLKNLDLEAKKSELNFYRIYCDYAAEILSNVEEEAPYATVVIRKGLPILDRNLKELLKEIKETAKIIYKESKGTNTEEIAYVINKEVQKWEIGSQEYLKLQIENLVCLLKFYVPNTEDNYLILNKADKIMQEQDIVKQYMLLNNLIPQIITIQVSKKTDSILKEIQELRSSVDKLVTSNDELQRQQACIFMIQKNLEYIKNNIPEMRGKIDEVLNELYSSSGITYKLKVAIPLIPQLVTYEMETDVSKTVADSIHELKNQILLFKK